MFSTIHEQCFFNYLDDFLTMFIDNLLIYSQTLEEHKKHVEVSNSDSHSNNYSCSPWLSSQTASRTNQHKSGRLQELCEMRAQELACFWQTKAEVVGQSPWSRSPSCEDPMQNQRKLNHLCVSALLSYLNQALNLAPNLCQSNRIQKAWYSFVWRSWHWGNGCRTECGSRGLQG